MANDSDPIKPVCAACGYDLTHAVVGRPCPECGAEVEWRVANGGETTRRQAVTIALRLVAVLIAFQSLVLIDIMVWSLLSLFVAGSPQIGAGEWLMMVGQGLPFLIRLGIAVLVWLVAARLAAFLVPLDGALIQSGGIGPQQLLSIGLILFGVFAVIYGIAQLFDRFISTWPALTGTNAPLYGMSSGVSLYTAIVWTAAGVLLLGWPRLRLWLGRDLDRG